MSATEIQTLYNNQAVDTLNTETRYYHAATQRVAMRKNGTLYYLLSDHPSIALRAGLGSTNKTFRLNPNGSVTEISELRYKAWGETRFVDGNSPTDRTYTGQRASDAVGLMFYNARWYDPSLGRFISADSIIPDPYNP